MKKIEERVIEFGTMFNLTKEIFPCETNNRMFDRSYYSKILNGNINTTLTKEYLKNIPDVIFRTKKSLQNSIDNHKEKCPIYSTDIVMPQHQHIISTNDDNLLFMKKYLPQYLPAYEGFAKDIQRSDFWRYSIVYYYGGIYVDMDVEIFQPIETWIQLNENSYHESFTGNINVIIGYEALLPGIFQQFTQWVFASSPKHPMMKFVLDYISNEFNRTKNQTNNLNPKNEDILITTGPIIWSKAIETYLNENYKVNNIYDFTKGNKIIGDIYIAPVNGFGCGVEHSHSRHVSKCQAPDVLLLHHFRGSWRQ